jgi:hypothetical protein
MNDKDRFSILNSLPWVVREYTHTKRTQEITLKLNSKTLATKLRVFKYGKEIESLYYITEDGITASNP